MQSRIVNVRQLEVLSWIADGCPDGVMLDFSYKTTAAALRNRGLAAVSKRGGWHATITEAGRRYLELGGYPDDAETTRPSARPVPAPPKPTPKPTSPRPNTVHEDPKPTTPGPILDPEMPPRAVRNALRQHRPSPGSP